jgi:hypothetical protein
MRRSLVAAGTCLLLGVSLAPAVPTPREKKEITCLDLQSKANAKLKTPFHGGAAGNHLAELPRGEQKLGGVKFDIGDGLIQLAGKQGGTLPDKVEGIPVGRPFAKLYVLHAVGTGYETPNGTVVARFTVHYQDRTKATVDIVYGQDVLDWWYYANSPTVTRGRVAWTGDNPAAKNGNAKVRLYLTTWENPRPKKKVSHMDYSSTKTTLAQPFCVALTVEGK